MDARRIFTRLACGVSDWFASPAALAAVPGGCIAWLAFGFSVNALTLVLSVLAITMTQLVLVGQIQGERAMHRKVDELVHAIPGADDGVAGQERVDD